MYCIIAWYNPLTVPDAVDGVFRAHGRLASPVEVKLGEDVFSIQTAVIDSRRCRCVDFDLSCGNERYSGQWNTKIRGRRFSKNSGKRYDYSFLQESSNCAQFVKYRTTFFYYVWFYLLLSPWYSYARGRVYISFMRSSFPIVHTTYPLVFLSFGPSLFRLTTPASYGWIQFYSAVIATYLQLRQVSYSITEALPPALITWKTIPNIAASLPACPLFLILILLGFMS